MSEKKAQKSARLRKNLVANKIAPVVEELQARTGLQYVEVRKKMARYLRVREYTQSNFDHKFRRPEIPDSTKYDVDELLALIRAFKDDLRVELGCKAAEALKIFTLADVPFVSDLREIFSESDYAEASALYPDSSGISPSPSPVPAPKGTVYLKPTYPESIVVGRERDIEAILARVGIGAGATRHPMTVIRGWPGVGKTTLINKLIYDEALNRKFPDGVLWTSLGHTGEPLRVLQSWAKQLGLMEAAASRNVAEVINHLRVVFQTKPVLMIIDDIWTEEQANRFRELHTDKTTFVFTTRFIDLARILAPTPDDIYVLKVLDEQQSLEVLRNAAGGELDSYDDDLGELMSSLEGLPLVLRVAGALIGERLRTGLGIDRLANELQTNFQAFKAKAPADRVDEETGLTPTIGLLFRRSIQTLPTREQMAFACIGTFVPKPATFALDAFQGICELEEPEETVQILAGRGLLEPLKNARFQMHYTLAMYAKHLLSTNLAELAEGYAP